VLVADDDPPGPLPFFPTTISDLYRCPIHGLWIRSPRTCSSLWALQAESRATAELSFGASCPTSPSGMRQASKDAAVLKHITPLTKTKRPPN